MIFAIKPFEIHDGDGIRTTVFFKGCPLRCRWCHNPESHSFSKELFYDPDRCTACGKCATVCGANLLRDGGHILLRENCDLCGRCADACPHGAFEVVGDERNVAELAREILRDELFMKESGGGVTFSGGEPLMQVDLCVALARHLKERGIHLAIDTSLAVPREAIDRILPYADCFLVDLKAIDEGVHIACTGVTNSQILQNLRYLDTKGLPFEVRYPYVPTMNDGEVERIARVVKELKNVTCVRILAYHSYAERKYHALGKAYPIPDVPLPKKKELLSAAERMHACGVTCAIESFF
jgi:pyruvate formate lyase activating enzyme